MWGCLPCKAVPFSFPFTLPFSFTFTFSLPLSFTLGFASDNLWFSRAEPQVFPSDSFALLQKGAFSVCCPLSLLLYITSVVSLCLNLQKSNKNPHSAPTEQGIETRLHTTTPSKSIACRPFFMPPYLSKSAVPHDPSRNSLDESAGKSAQSQTPFP